MDPDPTDRSKAGAERRPITNGGGIPLAAKQTPANVQESCTVVALAEAIRSIRRPRGRPRKRPVRVVADKANDAVEIGRQFHRRGIGSLTARRVVEDRGLGRFRWVGERGLAWMNQLCGLRIRYEQRPDVHDASLTIGCILVCWNSVRSCFC